MTFKNSDLSVLTYANNFTLWHYITEDEDITTRGYFNPARDMVRVNDSIITSCNTLREVKNKTYVVHSKDGLNVEIGE